MESPCNTGGAVRATYIGHENLCARPFPGTLRDDHPWGDARRVFTHRFHARATGVDTIMTATGSSTGL